MATFDPGPTDLVVRLYDEDDFPSGLRYGGWSDDKEGDYLVPGYLSGSDYSGNLVEQSNARAFKETFSRGEDKWWTEVSGGHGTFAIVIATKKVPKKTAETVTEFLDGLQSYPLANEDLHSQMEMEAQDEAWENWAAKDFARALEKKFGIDLDKVTGGDVYELFHDAMEESNENWVNEQGGEMWINIERLVKAISEDDIEAFEAKHGDIGWASQRKEYEEQEAKVELLHRIRGGQSVSEADVRELTDEGLVYSMRNEIFVSPSGRAVIAEWEKQNG